MSGPTRDSQHNAGHVSRNEQETGGSRTNQPRGHFGHTGGKFPGNARLRGAVRPPHPPRYRPQPDSRRASAGLGSAQLLQGSRRGPQARQAAGRKANRPAEQEDLRQLVQWPPPAAPHHDAGHPARVLRRPSRPGTAQPLVECVGTGLLRQQPATAIQRRRPESAAVQNRPQAAHQTRGHDHRHRRPGPGLHARLLPRRGGPVLGSRLPRRTRHQRRNLAAHLPPDLRGTELPARPEDLLRRRRNARWSGTRRPLLDLQGAARWRATRRAADDAEGPPAVTIKASCPSQDDLDVRLRGKTAELPSDTQAIIRRFLEKAQVGSDGSIDLGWASLRWEEPEP